MNVQLVLIYIVQTTTQICNLFRDQYLNKYTDIHKWKDNCVSSYKPTMLLTIG